MVSKIKINFGNKKEIIINILKNMITINKILFNLIKWINFLTSISKKTKLIVNKLTRSTFFLLKLNTFNKVNNFKLIILIIISTINFPIYLSKEKIIITLTEGGEQQIFNSAFHPYPSEVYVNGYQYNGRNSTFHFNDNINGFKIELIWDSPLLSCDYMFSGANKIKTIDLSYFDTSKVTSMKQMFQQCYSLVYINFTNFRTSNVTDMGTMFHSCTSLFSLDLNMFDTSKVNNMELMFKECKTLTYLNINKFDTSSVNNMREMFKDCFNLTFLDLSNFDTSKVNNMNNMFENCDSLKYLNIINFNTQNVGFNVNNMFQNNYDLIICVNKTNLNVDTQSLLKSYKINCSSICFLNENNKLIFETEECIDDCIKHDQNKFEYNKICYTSCPNGTHNSSEKYKCEKDNNNIYTTIIEIDLNYNNTINKLNDKDCSHETLYINKDKNECINECNGNDFFNKICEKRDNNDKAKDHIITNIEND